MTQYDLNELSLGFQQQSISALAKAISLVESTNPTHQEQAEKFLKQILPHSKKSKVIGITGTPGVGKSTFIENFGIYSIEKGGSLAVLAIDPSSELTGGSLLGDKTRMNQLAVHPQVFIRPSPARGQLGGVARKTLETIKLCEAFGFDTIWVESVGVGQSEWSLKKMVDFFLLLLQPGGGDDLQGVKRGILEHIDAVAITKNDGPSKPLAALSKNQMDLSLSILRPHRTPNTFLISSTEKTGFEELKNFFEQYFLKNSEEIQRARETANLFWLDEVLTEKILRHFATNQNIQKIKMEWVDKMKNENLFPFEVAEKIFKASLKE